MKPFVSEGFSYGDKIVIQCPFCDLDYHKIIRVGTELDNEYGDEAEIYKGTSLVIERNTGERRSALRIDLQGECGHSWSLILQQHKGVIAIFARELKTSRK